MRTLFRWRSNEATPIREWGPVPDAAWSKTYDAYGAAVHEYYDKALKLLRDPKHRSTCLATMSIDPAFGDSIVATLEQHHPEEGSRPDATSASATP